MTGRDKRTGSVQQQSAIVHGAGKVGADRGARTLSSPADSCPAGRRAGIACGLADRPGLGGIVSSPAVSPIVRRAPMPAKASQPLSAQIGKGSTWDEAVNDIAWSDGDVLVVG